MTAPYRYPTSGWLVRRLLRALGYGRKQFPTRRTSSRVFRDGEEGRESVFNEVDFIADALDLLCLPTIEVLPERSLPGLADELAPHVHRALRSYDRLRGELNSLDEVSYGGVRAALPLLRLAVARVGLMLGGLSYLWGGRDRERVLNPFARGEFERIVSDFLGAIPA